MPYTDAQILDYAKRMKAKGVPVSTIKIFIDKAKKEQTASVPQGPPKSALQQAGDAVDKVMHPLSDLVVGAAKGVADLPREAAQLGSNLGKAAANNPISQFLFKNVVHLPNSPVNQIASQAQQGVDKGVQRTALTTPTNTAQKVGYGAEKIAEFFVPGPTIARVPASAGALPFLTNLAERVGLSAANMTARTALQTGGENPEAARQAGVLGGVLPLVGEAARGLGFLGKAVFKTIAAANSGVPAPAIDFAFDNPEATQSAIKEMAADRAMGVEKVIKEAEDAVDTIKEARGAVYQQELAAIKAQGLPNLPIGDLQDAAQKTISDVGRLNITEDGVEMTKATTLPKSLVGDLNDLWTSVSEWNQGPDAQPTDPASLNDLKKVVDSYHRPQVGNSSDVKIFNKIVTDISNNISSYAESNSQEIADLNAHYTATSNTLDLMKQDLSLGKEKPTMALRKLLNVFNPKSEVFRPLVEELGQRSGKNLMADIAGLTMSRWTPEGLGKYLTTLGAELGTGAAATIATGSAALPEALAGAAGLASTGSPRIVGAIATGLGKVAQSGLGSAISNAAQGIGSKIIQDINPQKEPDKQSFNNVPDKTLNGPKNMIGMITDAFTVPVAQAAELPVSVSSGFDRGAAQVDLSKTKEVPAGESKQFRIDWWKTLYPLPTGWSIKYVNSLPTNDKLDPEANGLHDPKTKTIYINSALLKGDDKSSLYKLDETVVHEIAHALGMKHGFDMETWIHKALGDRPEEILQKKYSQKTPAIFSQGLTGGKITVPDLLLQAKIIRMQKQAIAQSSVAPKK